MRRLLLGFVALGGLYGCYDYTLAPDGDESHEPKAKQNDATDPINPSSVESGDSNNKTPTNGDAPVITNTGTPAPAAVDAGTDAATTTTACNTTCGGPYTLLKCNADGSKSFVGKCANGCSNGACAAATKCVSGGSYCGGDKVNGEPDVLYKCGADGLATTVQTRCTNGCVVATAGTDDYCK